MKAADFETTEFGEVVIGTDDLYAWFQPRQLPRELDLDTQTVMALSRADEALGRLAGVGRMLRDPKLLMRPYAIKEALASARIEGTQAELQEVFQAEARPSTAAARHTDVRTVSRYLRSLENGLDLVRSRAPIDFELVAASHRVLMGPDHPEAGVLRDRPVWLGSPTERPETAVFVPPIGESLADSLSDWNAFIAEPPQMPALIRAALLHYQFLTIHPFVDGNGRVGRLFVLLYLANEERLPVPLLYLSPFFERRRRDYYDRLQAVRQRGEIQGWLQFFLTAVEIQANDGVDRAARLLDLREFYRSELAGSRSRSTELVELLFENPVVTAALVRDHLEVSTQGAHNLIRSLEDRGWLSRYRTDGRGGGSGWLAHEIYSCIADDVAPNEDRPVAHR